MEHIITILLIILVVAAILVMLKVMAELGIKAFTCGCLLILVAIAVLILMGKVEIPGI